MTRQEKAERDEKYSHADLPPVKNHLAFHYRAFMKLFFIGLIGLGSMVLAVLVFPWIKVFVHPKQKFQTAARAFVSRTFAFSLFLMRITGVVKVYAPQKEQLRSLHSKVIAANHCSMLDFVVLMSLIPNANCIVQESYGKTPLAGVIRQAYILNSVDFTLLKTMCKETLDMGNNVIIFPEGTRTPRHGKVSYKKGAARIARFAGCGIQPVLIAGSDKYGLGKHDPFWSFNHVEPLIYDIQLLPQIQMEQFSGYSDIASAKKITDQIHSEILSAAEKYREHHPLCKTVNHVQ
ncbi:MAG: 1-acyl-sn-glycerol-3-phosphate acyltransferase [Treponema sp.]|nr:1-acyl-sn-glycerol-3-phosphate acyltransferase [Treponema sp.]